MDRIVLKKFKSPSKKNAKCMVCDRKVSQLQKVCNDCVQFYETLNENVTKVSCTQDIKCFKYTQSNFCPLHKFIKCKMYLEKKKGRISKRSSSSAESISRDSSIECSIVSDDIITGSQLSESNDQSHQIESIDLSQETDSYDQSQEILVNQSQETICIDESEKPPDQCSGEVVDEDSISILEVKQPEQTEKPKTAKRGRRTSSMSSNTKRVENTSMTSNENNKSADHNSADSYTEGNSKSLSLKRRTRQSQDSCNQEDTGFWNKHEKHKVKCDVCQYLRLPSLNCPQVCKKCYQFYLTVQCMKVPTRCTQDAGCVKFSSVKFCPHHKFLKCTESINFDVSNSDLSADDSSMNINNLPQNQDKENQNCDSQSTQGSVMKLPEIENNKDPNTPGTGVLCEVCRIRCLSRSTDKLCSECYQYYKTVETNLIAVNCTQDAKCYGLISSQFCPLHRFKACEALLEKVIAGQSMRQFREAFVLLVRCDLELQLQTNDNRGKILTLRGNINGSELSICKTEHCPSARSEKNIKLVDLKKYENISNRRQSEFFKILKLRTRCPGSSSIEGADSSKLNDENNSCTANEMNPLYNESDKFQENNISSSSYMVESIDTSSIADACPTGSNAQTIHEVEHESNGISNSRKTVTSAEKRTKCNRDENSNQVEDNGKVLVLMRKDSSTAIGPRPTRNAIATAAPSLKESTQTVDIVQQMTNDSEVRLVNKRNNEVILDGEKSGLNETESEISKNCSQENKGSRSKSKYRKLDPTCEKRLNKKPADFQNHNSTTGSVSSDINDSKNKDLNVEKDGFHAISKEMEVTGKDRNDSRSGEITSNYKIRTEVLEKSKKRSSNRKERYTKQGEIKNVNKVTENAVESHKKKLAETHTTPRMKRMNIEQNIIEKTSKTKDSEEQNSRKRKHNSSPSEDEECTPYKKLRLQENVKEIIERYKSSTESVANDLRVNNNCQEKTDKTDFRKKLNENQIENVDQRGTNLIERNVQLDSSAKYSESNMNLQETCMEGSFNDTLSDACSFFEGNSIHTANTEPNANACSKETSNNSQKLNQKTENVNELTNVNRGAQKTIEISTLSDQSKEVNQTSKRMKKANEDKGKTTNINSQTVISKNSRNTTHIGSPTLSHRKKTDKLSTKAIRNEHDQLSDPFKIVSTDVVAATSEQLKSYDADCTKESEKSKASKAPAIFLDFVAQDELDFDEEENLDGPRLDIANSQQEIETNENQESNTCIDEPESNIPANIDAEKCNAGDVANGNSTKPENSTSDEIDNNQSNQQQQAATNDNNEGTIIHNGETFTDKPNETNGHKTFNLCTEDLPLLKKGLHTRVRECHTELYNFISLVSLDKRSSVLKSEFTKKSNDILFISIACYGLYWNYSYTLSHLFRLLERLVGCDFCSFVTNLMRVVIALAREKAFEDILLEYGQKCGKSYLCERAELKKFIFQKALPYVMTKSAQSFQCFKLMIAENLEIPDKLILETARELTLRENDDSLEFFTQKLLDIYAHRPSLLDLLEKEKKFYSLFLYSLPGDIVIQHRDKINHHRGIMNQGEDRNEWNKGRIGISSSNTPNIFDNRSISPLSLNDQYSNSSNLASNKASYQNTHDFPNPMLRNPEQNVFSRPLRTVSNSEQNDIARPFGIAKPSSEYQISSSIFQNPINLFGQSNSKSSVTPIFRRESSPLDANPPALQIFGQTSSKNSPSQIFGQASSPTEANPPVSQILRQASSLPDANQPKTVFEISPSKECASQNNATSTPLPKGNQSSRMLFGNSISFGQLHLKDSPLNSEASDSIFIKSTPKASECSNIIFGKSNAEFFSETTRSPCVQTSFDSSHIFGQPNKTQSLKIFGSSNNSIFQMQTFTSTETAHPSTSTSQLFGSMNSSTPLPLSLSRTVSGNTTPTRTFINNSGIFGRHKTLLSLSKEAEVELVGTVTPSPRVLDMIVISDDSNDSSDVTEATLPNTPVISGTSNTNAGATSGTYNTNAGVTSGTSNTNAGDTSGTSNANASDTSGTSNTNAGDTSGTSNANAGDTSGTSHANAGDTSGTSNNNTGVTSGTSNTNAGDTSGTSNTNAGDTSGTSNTNAGVTSGTSHPNVGDTSGTSHANAVDTSGTSNTNAGDTSGTSNTNAGDTSGTSNTNAGDICGTSNTNAGVTSSTTPRVFGENITSNIFRDIPIGGENKPTIFSNIEAPQSKINECFTSCQSTLVTSTHPTSVNGDNATNSSFVPANILLGRDQNTPNESLDQSTSYVSLDQSNQNVSYQDETNITNKSTEKKRTRRISFSAQLQEVRLVERYEEEVGNLNPSAAVNGSNDLRDVLNRKQTELPKSTISDGQLINLSQSFRARLSQEYPKLNNEEKMKFIQDFYSSPLARFHFKQVYYSCKNSEDLITSIYSLVLNQMIESNGMMLYDHLTTISNDWHYSSYDFQEQDRTLKRIQKFIHTPVICKDKWSQLKIFVYLYMFRVLKSNSHFIPLMKQYNLLDEDRSSWLLTWNESDLEEFCQNLDKVLDEFDHQAFSYFTYIRIFLVFLAIYSEKPQTFSTTDLMFRIQKPLFKLLNDFFFMISNTDDSQPEDEDITFGNFFLPLVKKVVALLPTLESVRTSLIRGFVCYLVGRNHHTKHPDYDLAIQMILKTKLKNPMYSLHDGGHIIKLKDIYTAEEMFIVFYYALHNISPSVFNQLKNNETLLQVQIEKFTPLFASLLIQNELSQNIPNLQCKDTPRTRFLQYQKINPCMTIELSDVQPQDSETCFILDRDSTIAYIHAVHNTRLSLQVETDSAPNLR